MICVFDLTRIEFFDEKNVIVSKDNSENSQEITEITFVSPVFCVFLSLFDETCDASSLRIFGIYMFCYTRLFHLRHQRGAA